MESIFIYALIFALLTYLLTYFTGHILLSWVRMPDGFPMLREFSKVCTGFFSILTGYALLRTHGISIFSGMIPLFLFLLYWLKQKQAIHNVAEFRSALSSMFSIRLLLLQCLLLVGGVLYTLWKVKDPVSGQTYEVNADLYNYAIIMEHLNKMGIEGGYPDWYSGILPIRNLYHFGELWYGAFYTLLSGQTAFNVFFFQLFPQVMVIYYLGASALIEQYTKMRAARLHFRALLIFFICGISFYLPHHTIFTRGDWWDMGMLSQPKYLFTALFVFYALLAVKRRFLFPLILLAMAALLSCTVAAAALLLSVGAILLLLFATRKISFKQAMRFSLPVLLTLLYIGAYTQFSWYSNRQHAVQQVFAVKQEAPIPLMTYIRLAINCFAGQFIKSVLSLAAYLLLVLLLLRDKEKVNQLREPLTLLLVLHVCSIAAYAVFSFLGVDTVQLWSIVYVPLSAIFCFLIVIVLLETAKPLWYIPLFLLIALSVRQSLLLLRGKTVDMEYMASVKRVYDGSTAVTFISEDFMDRDWSKNINLYPPSPGLKMYYKAYNPVCLSVFEVPDSRNAHFQKALEEIKHNSVFFRYTQWQKERGKFISTEQSKLDFIEQYKVKFIFTYGKAKLPAPLIPQIKSMARDTTCDTYFYALK